MIVLTGGAGFIGSCLLAELNARGINDIIVVDHLTPAKQKNLVNKKYKAYYEKYDFLRQVEENKLDSAVDTFLHMGACSSTTLQDAEYFEYNNFYYTQTLAQWALKNRARFIYASSAATYGDGHLGYSDDDSTSRRCQPLNLYGESKQKFDLWILNNGYINDVVGLKFFNVYGPNEYHKDDMRSVVCKAYQRVVSEGKMVLFKSYNVQYGDGEQKRDFIYVKDAVAMTLHFLEHRKIGGIFNVGTGESRSWNDVARSLFQAVGKPLNIEYVEMPQEMRPRYQYFTQAKIQKIRAAGFERPILSLENAIQDYVGYLSRGTYI